MSREHRLALLLLALGVVVFTAHSTRAFLLVDACLDAGGRYLADPPRCDVDGRVRPLATLVRGPGAWLLALGPAGVAGALVYVVGRAALRRVAAADRASR